MAGDSQSGEMTEEVNARLDCGAWHVRQPAEIVIRP